MSDIYKIRRWCGGSSGFSFLIIVWCLKPFKMQNITKRGVLLPGRPPDLRSDLLLVIHLLISTQRCLNTTRVRAKPLSMFIYVQFYVGATRCLQSNRVYVLRESWAQSPQTGRRRHYVEFKIRGFWRYKHVDEFSHSLLKVTVINVCRPDFPGFTRAVKMSIQYVRLQIHQIRQRFVLTTELIWISDTLRAELSPPTGLQHQKQSKGFYLSRSILFNFAIK